METGRTSKVIGIRVPKEMAGDIERRADKRRMSVGEYIRWCVEQQLRRR